jgi:hypothetical protein
MFKLTATLKEQMDKSDKLNKIIWENLKDIGYVE